MERSLPEVIASLLAEFGNVAKMLWTKGWAERNGGNLSMLLPEGASGFLRNPVHSIPLETFLQELEGRILLVTGTGSRMRDVADHPEKHCCLLRVEDSGTRIGVYPIAETDQAIFPTSELPSHLCIHAELNSRGFRQSVVVHTHPVEMVALTHIPDLLDQIHLNRTLLSMIPEAAIYVPEGVGLVSYRPPGTEELSRATIEALRDHDVALWEKHGCLAVANSLQEAFDRIDTLNKAAQIYFTCRQAGIDPEGLSEQQLEDLRRRYVIPRSRR